MSVDSPAGIGPPGRSKRSIACRLDMFSMPRVSSLAAKDLPGQPEGVPGIPGIPSVEF